MDWVINLEEKLGGDKIFEAEDNWKKRAIYRVPTWAKELNRRAYLPQTVSFGPYHFNEVELKLQMDVHKVRALHFFLEKSGKPRTTYVNALQAVLPDLMASYNSLDICWQQDNFLQLMLLDGCFMLEILRANKAIYKPGDVYRDYGRDADPIFSYHGKVYVMPYIRRDMLMLENQLPMLLLRTLVTVEATIAEEDQVIYLNRIILRFVNPDYFIPYRHQQVDSHHVLDLYRRSLVGLEHQTKTMIRELRRGIPSIVPSADIVRSATKLCDYGVYFKPSDSTSIMDISFHGGELKLPSIIVNESTESAFLNLVAFERVHVGAGNEVTYFVSFMGDLINSAKDVSLLNDRKILHNNIGSEEAIANLFHRISKDVTPDPEGSLEKVHYKLDCYCDRPWNKWHAYCAYLHRKFFGKDPLAILTLFFFLLTIAQTLYAILAYHHPLKP